MKVFVAGGTGAIGSHAIPALVDAGHDVTALARTAKKAAMLIRRGATPVTVSIFDRAALRAAFTKHDAIVTIWRPPSAGSMAPALLIAKYSWPGRGGVSA
jgi:uncharacterized protein YbjT (DUF2867 family)